MATKTEIDLTAAEIAAHLGCTPQAFNNWKRLAMTATGKAFGEKRGKSWYFSPAEVEEILGYSPSGDRSQNAPQQTYENEDMDQAEDVGFMVLAHQTSDLAHDLKAVLTLADKQDDQLVELAVSYLDPVNRRARLLQKLGSKLQTRQTINIHTALEGALRHPSALPQRTIDPAFI